MRETDTSDAEASEDTEEAWIHQNERKTNLTGECKRRSCPICMCACLLFAVFASLIYFVLKSRREFPWFYKIPLDKYPFARCLDGSPGAYWFMKAKSGSEKLWVISLLGGGSCVTWEECESMNTLLKSSSSYPPFLLPGYLFEDVLSPNQKNNPRLADWNHVRILYCSGDWWLGTLNETSASNDSRFSGFNILQAAIDHLVTEHSLDKADMLVFSGESAGGIGVFANLDYIADRLPGVKVVGAPLAGFYFSVPNASIYQGPGATPKAIQLTPEALKKSYYLYSMRVPERCARAKPHEPWMCALAGVSYETLSTPVFIMEALFDPVQRHHSGSPANCNLNSQTVAWCKQWSANMSKHLDLVLRRGKSNRSAAGLFSPACQIHTDFRGILINNTGYIEALDNWLFRPSTQYIYEDTVLENELAIQLNPSCANV